MLLDCGSHAHLYVILFLALGLGILYSFQNCTAAWCSSAQLLCKAALQLIPVPAG